MNLPMGVVTPTTMLAFCLDLVRELEREKIVMGPWEERNHYWIPHIPGAVDQEERRRWNTWWKLEI